MNNEKRARKISNRYFCYLSDVIRQRLNSDIKAALDVKDDKTKELCARLYNLILDDQDGIEFMEVLDVLSVGGGYEKHSNRYKGKIVSLEEVMYNPPQPPEGGE